MQRWRRFALTADMRADPGANFSALASCTISAALTNPPLDRCFRVVSFFTAHNFLPRRFLASQKISC